MHVYQKGGDMVHTLRGIMGDDAFFRACADFQDSFKFQSVNTEDMMNFFNNYSRFDLAHFFEQWIQTKGFCHFYLFSALKSGNKYNVRIKQDQRFNNIVYEGSPYTLRAYNSDLGFMDTVLVLSGTDQVFEIQLPFMPVLWVLDPDEWISDAITENNLRLDTGSIGIHQLQDAFGLVEVHFIEGEEILRLENHWVRPDHYYMNIPKLALHTQRYWTYDGSWGSSFEADLYLEYNGLGSFYLDNELIHKTEDSLVLLYRPNAWSQWSIAENIEFDMGSKFDRRGIIKVINAAKGLYALAMYDQALLLGVDKVAVNITQFHPNPADTYVEVSFTEIRTAEFRLELTSPKGELINAFNFTNTREKHRIDVSELPTGLYYLILVENNYAYEPLKLIIH
jgi:hypothetical protein